MSDYRKDSSGKLLRIIGALLERWPLLLVVAFIVSPVGPHMRLKYTYYGSFESKVYKRCWYLGSRGVIEPLGLTPNCPVFVVLDAREWIE